MALKEKQKTNLSTIKRLYEDALEIFDSRDFYTMKRKIPKHTAGSFDEMVRQNSNPAVYKDWWMRAEECFKQLGLNFLRFKRTVASVESSDEYGISYAGYLALAIDELQKMITDPNYLDSYGLSKRKPQSWPEITHKNGLIVQGDRFHKFSNSEAILILNKLWDNRRILRPDKTVAKEGQPLAWSALPKSADSNKSTAQAVNKSMREKGITLLITYPKKIDGLLLVVTEKRTN